MINKTEITWYKTLVLIASALAIGFGITNMVYFNEIRTKGNCSPVSSGTANTMVWLNLILVIFAAIVFFWSLFRLIFSGHEETLVNSSYNLHTHIHADSDATPISPISLQNPVPSVNIVPPNSPGALSYQSFQV